MVRVCQQSDFQIRTMHPQVMDLAIAQCQLKRRGLSGGKPLSDDTPAGFCQCCISIVAGVTTRRAADAAERICSCLATRQRLVRPVPSRDLRVETGQRPAQF